MFRKFKTTLTWPVWPVVILYSAIAIWVFHAEGYSLLHQVKHLFATTEEWQKSWNWFTHKADKIVLFPSFGLFIATVIGFYFAQKRIKISNEQVKTAIKQLTLAEKGHITDRYSKAIELIGHRKATIRIGGFYALQNIAEENNDYLEIIQDVILSFIQKPPYKDFGRPIVQQYKTKTAPRYIRSCPDIHVACDVFQKIRNKNQAFLLHKAKLSYLDLGNINLEGATLKGANLEKSNLEGANLDGADLEGANLENANLKEAHLYRACLRMANLRYVNFERASLIESDFTQSDLLNANLQWVDFERAVLNQAILAGSNLELANLEYAKLNRTNLIGTILYFTNISGSDFKNNPGLEQSQLDKAWAWSDIEPSLSPRLDVSYCPATNRKNDIDPLTPPIEWLMNRENGKV